MKKNRPQEGTAAYYENLLRERIRAQEQNRRSLEGDFRNSDGALCKALRVAYWIVSLYILFFDLVLALGCVFDLTDYQRLADSRSILTVISVLMVLLVVALVFWSRRPPKAFVTLAISLPTSVVSAFITFRWYTGLENTTVSKSFQDGIYTKYLCCNLPVILLPLLAFFVWLMLRRDRRQEDELYERLTRRLYAKNQPEDGGILSDAQWCAILKAEVDSAPAAADGKQKRSSRKRDRKKQEAMDKYAVSVTDPVKGICPLCHGETTLQKGDQRGICLVCGEMIDARAAVRDWEKSEPENEEEEA